MKLQYFLTMICLAWVLQSPSFAQGFIEEQQRFQDSVRSVQQGIVLPNIENGEDSLTLGDSTLIELDQKKPQYVEREYNHKEQVITGGVMMLCIGFILVTSNNFNPKH